MYCLLNLALALYAPAAHATDGFVLSAPSIAQTGGVISLRADLPPSGRLDGFNIYFVVTDGSSAPVCTPASFGGDCLDVTGSTLLVQQRPVTDGTAMGVHLLPNVTPLDRVSIQAVRIVRNQPIRLSNVVEVDIVSPCASDALEPDDWPLLAEPVVAPTQLSGLQSCDADDDFVAIDLAAGEMLRVDASFSSVDGDIDLYLHAQGAVSKNDWLVAAESVSDNESLRFIAPDAGTYLVRTSLYDEGADGTLGASYSLSVETGFLPGEDYDGDGCADLIDPAPAVASLDENDNGSGADCEPCDASGDQDADGICDHDEVPVATGETCLEDTDCISGLCGAGGVCVDPPPCNGHPDLCSRAFRDVAYATTNNANVSVAYGVLLPVANQSVRISTQLDHGIRGLAMDLAYFNSAEAEAGITSLCHGSICLDNVPTLDALDEVGAWLDAHPREVVSILLENTEVQTEDLWNEIVAAGLEDRLPTIAGGVHPLDRTLGDLIAADQRLFVFSPTVGPVPSNSRILDSGSFVRETTKLVAPQIEVHGVVVLDHIWTCECVEVDDCDPEQRNVYVVNHMASSSLVFGDLTQAPAANHMLSLLDHVDECMAHTGRIPNFVATDFYTLDLGPLEVVDYLNGVDAIDGRAAVGSPLPGLQPCEGSDCSTTATYEGDAGCTGGSFYDLLTGGCWSCPTGTNRTVFAVDGDDACAEPPVQVAPATFVGPSNECTGDQFFDPIFGGTCWTCPSGFNRSLAAVTESNACSRLNPEQPRSASFVKSTGCPSGQFNDPRNGGECWSCPSGYNRTIHAVTSGSACERPAQTLHSHATRRGNASFFSCPSGQFYDIIHGGTCWTCPSGYSRTASHVESSTACRRVVGATVSSASYHGRSGCTGSSFFDPRNGGECWTCPSGTVRTAAAVTASNACVIPASESLASATQHGSVGCEDGAFYDLRNGGECWSCPSGWNRTLSAVNASDACSLPNAGAFHPATYEGRALCEDVFVGSFFDPRNGGECWSCPENHVRWLTAVDAADACVLGLPIPLP